MSIVLTDGFAAWPLPADMEWVDEHEWTPPVQSAEYTLTGALVVETATRLAGREITLRSGPDFAVLDLATLDALYAWGAVPGKVMTLTLRGMARQVMFRHHDAPAIEAEALIPDCDGSRSDLWRATLKFMEV